MKDSWIEQIFDALKEIRECELDLQEISDCLFVVGNEKLGDKISYIAADLKLAGEVIQQAAREGSKEAFDTSWEHTGNILTMALAMADKNEEKNND